VAEALGNRAGRLESGEMGVRDAAGRTLVSAIFARWDRPEP
jgi:hypothetical protein